MKELKTSSRMLELITAVASKLTHFISWLISLLKKHVFTYFPWCGKSYVREKFSNYGVTVDGGTSCDIQVHDPRFFVEVATNAAMGLGESYMKGYWTTEDFPAFFKALLKDGDGFFNGSTQVGKLRWWQEVTLKIFNWVTSNLCSTERPVSTANFDANVYGAFLGSTMRFSCGYWKTATSLEQAQIHKMELLARKLKIKPGMTVLDIGCGWGALAKYLASARDVKVVGCTLYEEQREYARQQCAGLRVDIQGMEFCDKIKGKRFDRVISTGRFGLIGRANYRQFFHLVARCLKDDGIFLLDTIGVSHPNVRLSDPWVQKYIFPGLEYPYHTDILSSVDGLFVLEDWANLGFHYSRTLEAWLANLEQPKLEKMFGSEFYRMWRFYLHRQAAAFRDRKLQLWQIVLSKRGVSGGYDAEPWAE